MTSLSQNLDIEGEFLHGEVFPLQFGRDDLCDRLFLSGKSSECPSQFLILEICDHARSGEITLGTDSYFPPEVQDLDSKSD